MTHNELVATLAEHAVEYARQSSDEGVDPSVGDFAVYLAHVESPQTAGAGTARQTGDPDEFMQDALLRIVEYATLFQDGLADQDGGTVLDFCDWVWHKYDSAWDAPPSARDVMERAR